MSRDHDHADWLKGRREDQWEAERADPYPANAPRRRRPDHFGPRIGSGFEPDDE